MKKRIFLGLAPMLILFLGIGLYAVWLFSQLGGRIDVILRENFQSVVAGQQMKESAERMDSGLSFALTGEEERGRALFDNNVLIFQENLRIELGNITLPGEGELAHRIVDHRVRETADLELGDQPAVGCSQDVDATVPASRDHAVAGYVGKAGWSLAVS